LGQRLRELRNCAGETQAATAEAVGLARPYLSAVEAGRKNITLETLYALAEHFDVDPAQLLPIRRRDPDQHDTGTNTGRD
jgi:transcriptional regulator with XRE-family HTH domain